MKRYASYKASGVAWLGDVPSHWRIEKVKFQAHLRGEKTVGTNGARYVGMEHVLPKVGKFNPVVDGTQEEAESTVNVFSKGDVLFGKLRPYLAKCVVADTDGVCSSEFLVLSPADDVVPAYLNATMLMQEFIDAVDASTYGAKMPRADWEFIGQQRLPLPPPDEQQAIADYLDTETARIDDLIREKEELIGLLREWRQSVIEEAVTKGLDKGVVMKPSGVPWLGDVPAPWTVERLRFRVKLNPSPSKPLSAVHRVSFLPMEAIGDDGSLDLERTRTVGEVGSGYTYFEDGDVAIAKITPCYENGKGAVMAGLEEGAGFGTTELIVMRPIQDDCPRWLYYLTMCSAFRLPGEAMMQGAGGQKRVPDLFVKDYFAPIPPAHEQQAIADHLDEKTVQIDNLITHTQQDIALLKELRAATIADAVLGRVDVRDS